jgi:hypothetical protein
MSRPTAFERWLGRFYDHVEDDDLLAPLFGGKVRDQHRRDVVTWWCEVMAVRPAPPIIWVATSICFRSIADCI